CCRGVAVSFLQPAQVFQPMAEDAAASEPASGRHGGATGLVAKSLEMALAQLLLPWPRPGRVEARDLTCGPRVQLFSSVSPAPAECRQLGHHEALLRIELQHGAGAHGAARCG